MMIAVAFRPVVKSTLNILLSRSIGSTIASDYQRFCIRDFSLHFQPVKMSSLWVKSCDNDDRIHISLSWVVPSGSSKSVNMNRLKNEELRVTIDRLRLSLIKKLSKKVKKQKTEVDSANSEKSDNIPIEIIHNGTALDLSVPNEIAWVSGATLKIGETEIPVCYNSPSVKLGKLPTTIMEGFPLFPDVETEFTDIASCEFFWKTLNEKHINKEQMNIARGTLDLTHAVKSHSFIPQQCDIDKFVLLACVPQNRNTVGKMEAILSTVAITAGPGPCPFEKRHEFTKERSAKGQFRILSYNLLAQMYADTDLARNELFGHCPPYALEMDYRKHLLLKEILGYQADLLCMQEVDKSIFTSHLLPALSGLGYTGIFRPKAGSVSEGCASFICKDKFRVDNELDIVLSPFLAADPLCEDIWSKVSKVEPLRLKLEERSTILQVTVLESIENPGHYVCLANTHLYFHPTACNLRLIHAAVALRHLQCVCENYTQEGKKIAVVFCGDFNSAPHLGVYQLMTAQLVPTDHADWSSAGDEELLTDLELSQPMCIESACGVPPYTNFTQGFQATLDYIFMESDKLEVTQVVPLPDHQDVTANVALPSVVFPSDHLALICDLNFK